MSRICSGRIASAHTIIIIPKSLMRVNTSTLCLLEQTPTKANSRCKEFAPAATEIIFVKILGVNIS